MDHVAIMHKSWGLIPKILAGRKTIESRWSKNKISPFGKVKIGDRVFFKDSGEPITAKTKVFKVLEFDNLDKERIIEILKKYGGEGKIATSSIKGSLEFTKHKNYCTLIFLKNAIAVKPFGINKSGFGTGAAWLTVNDVYTIKL